MSTEGKRVIDNLMDLTLVAIPAQGFFDLGYLQYAGTACNSMPSICYHMWLTPQSHKLIDAVLFTYVVSYKSPSELHKFFIKMHVRKCDDFGTMYG